MKEATKYIVLVICSFLSLIAAALALSFALDKDFQQIPLMLILPELVFILFIITFVLFIVWSFKFSNNHPHIKELKTAGISLAVSIVVLILSLQVNPMINKAVYSSASSGTATEHPRPVNSIPEPTFKYNLTSMLWSDNFDFTSLPSVDDEEKAIIHDVYTVTKRDGDSYNLHLEKDKTTEDIISVMLTADKTDSFTDFGLLTLYVAASLDEELNHEDFVKRIFVENEDKEIFSEEFGKFNTTCSKNDKFIYVTFTIK